MSEQYITENLYSYPKNVLYEVPTLHHYLLFVLKVNFTGFYILIFMFSVREWCHEFMKSIAGMVILKKWTGLLFLFTLIILYISCLASKILYKLAPNTLSLKQDFIAWDFIALETEVVKDHPARKCVGATTHSQHELCNFSTNRN